jgi:hypothetical protein
LVNVDYTQEMVLPGVYLRGVFLATLLMQGVETAQLANDGNNFVLNKKVNF